MKKTTLLKTLAAAAAACLSLLMLTGTAIAGELETKITTTLKNAGKEIDVSSYGLTPQEAMDKYLGIVAQNPDLFYASNHVDCKFDKSTGKCVALICSYNTADITKQKAAFDAEITKMTSILGQTAYDKVKNVHDYIVTNYEYDQTNASLTAYDMMVSKKGICTGYAGMFKAAMDKLKIPCEIAISSDMQHEWAVIQLGDKWYNVDVTWDDPIGGGNTVTYANFLKSDKMMGMSGHFNWTTPSNVMCTDTKYDTMG